MSNEPEPFEQVGTSTRSELSSTSLVTTKLYGSATTSTCDWNEAAFRSALSDDGEVRKDMCFLNNLGLDDASMTAHLAQPSKVKVVSFGDYIREFHGARIS